MVKLDGLNSGVPNWEIWGVRYNAPLIGVPQQTLPYIMTLSGKSLFVQMPLQCPGDGCSSFYLRIHKNKHENHLMPSMLLGHRGWAEILDKESVNTRESARSTLSGMPFLFRPLDSLLNCLPCPSLWLWGEKDLEIPSIW